MSGQTRNTRILGHFGLRLREIPGPGPENGKSQFPGARGAEMKKKIHHGPGWLSANFFTFTFCPTGPSGAGNREIQVFQAILTQDSLWHLEKSRGWAENRKMQFPGARGTFGEKIYAPKFSP